MMILMGQRASLQKKMANCSDWYNIYITALPGLPEAAKRDCEQVYWLTQDFNEDGRRLYDKVANLTPFIKYSKPI